MCVYFHVSGRQAREGLRAKGDPAQVRGVEATPMEEVHTGGRSVRSTWPWMRIVVSMSMCIHHPALAGNLPAAQDPWGGDAKGDISPLTTSPGGPHLIGSRPSSFHRAPDASLTQHGMTVSGPRSHGRTRVAAPSRSRGWGQAGQAGGWQVTNHLDNHGCSWP